MITGREIFTSVEEWLASIKMGQYWETFRDNGFDLLETLTGVDDSVLESIGIKMVGHRTLLCRKIKDLVTSIGM